MCLKNPRKTICSVLFVIPECFIARAASTRESPPLYFSKRKILAKLCALLRLKFPQKPSQNYLLFLASLNAKTSQSNILCFNKKSFLSFLKRGRIFCKRTNLKTFCYIDIECQIFIAAIAVAGYRGRSTFYKFFRIIPKSIIACFKTKTPTIMSDIKFKPRTNK